MERAVFRTELASPKNSQPYMVAGTAAVRTICCELAPEERKAWYLREHVPKLASLHLNVTVDLRAPPTESVPRSLRCVVAETFCVDVPWAMATAMDSLPATTLDFFA